jgi:hypothetical protein
MTPYFKMYGQYCTNFMEAQQLAVTCSRASPELAQFLDMCREDSRCRGLSLPDFLIKPVQRICKYPLFFRELKKWTRDTHPCFRRLAEAAAAVDAIASHVNIDARAAQLQGALFDLYNALGGGQLAFPGGSASASYTPRTTSNNSARIAAASSSSSCEFLLSPHRRLIKSERCLVLDISRKPGQAQHSRDSSAASAASAASATSAASDGALEDEERPTQAARESIGQWGGAKGVAVAVLLNDCIVGCVETDRKRAVGGSRGGGGGDSIAMTVRGMVKHTSGGMTNDALTLVTREDRAFEWEIGSVLELALVPLSGVTVLKNTIFIRFAAGCVRRDEESV